MKIKELKQWGVQILKENNIEDANIQIKCLLSFILKTDLVGIVQKQEEDMLPEKEMEYRNAIQELIQGKPIQYITKTQEFMKLSFYVDENVLIPQPDTEILVEEVIEISKYIEDNKMQILDLCTGSGCIGISLVKNMPNIEKVYLVDISTKALEIAKKNVEMNQVKDKVLLLESDMFTKLPEQRMFSILVSNPPYITQAELTKLPEQVKREPKLALDGGIDGLTFYREIIKQAPRYVKEKGYLCLEIGYTQKEEVIDLIKKSGSYEEVYCKQDLAGLDRVIVAKLK